MARIDIQGCLEILGMNDLVMLDYESQHGVNFGFQCIAGIVFFCKTFIVVFDMYSTSLGVGLYILRADFSFLALQGVTNHQLF